MTWPQNVGNRISEDLNFRGYPQTPLQWTAFGGPTIEPPSVKSWIRPRVWGRCLSYTIGLFAGKSCPRMKNNLVSVSTSSAKRTNVSD